MFTTFKKNIKKSEVNSFFSYFKKCSRERECVNMKRLKVFWGMFWSMCGGEEGGEEVEKEKEREREREGQEDVKLILKIVEKI